MSRRLRDSESFPKGSYVEITLGPKKIRGKITWSIMSEVFGHLDHTVLRIDYDPGGNYIFVVDQSGKDVGIDATLRVLSNIGEQMELL